MMEVVSRSYGVGLVMRKRYKQEASEKLEAAACSRCLALNPKRDRKIRQSGSEMFESTFVFLLCVNPRAAEC